MATFTIPAVGEMVRVRSRRHVVEDVAPPKADRPTDQHLVTLACIEDDSAGDAAEILFHRPACHGDAQGHAAGHEDGEQRSQPPGGWQAFREQF